MDAPANSHYQPLLFPNTKGEGKIMSDGTLNKALHISGYRGEKNRKAHLTKNNPKLFIASTFDQAWSSLSASGKISLGIKKIHKSIGVYLESL